MKERDAARRFDRQVDIVLARAGRGGSAEIVPIECAGDIEMARELAGADFSSRSAAFATLRDTLPLMAPRSARADRRGGAFIAKLLRPFPAAIAAMVLVVALIQCTYPGGVPGLTKEIQETIVAEMYVGTHTSVIQYTSDQEAMARAVAAIPQEQKDRMWYIGTDGMGFGGGTPEGMSTAVSRFDTYEAARASAGMEIKTPRYMPEGFWHRDVFVPPGGRNVVAVYAGGGVPSVDIAIAQASVGESGGSAASDGSSSMTMTGTSTSVGSDSPYQSIDLDGTKAAWFAQGGVLVWESAGVSYTIAGRMLTLGQAKLIWRGLR